MTPHDRLERRIDRFVFSLLAVMITAGCVVACACSPDKPYCNEAIVTDDPQE